MPSILIPSIPPLLIALIFACGLPRALALPRIDNVLTRSHNTLSCTFELAGYAFDLCPLAGLAVDLDLHAASTLDLQSQAGDNLRIPGRRLRLALPFRQRGATPNVSDKASPSLSSGRKSIDNQCLKKDWICVSGIQTPENADEDLTSTSLSWEVVAGPGLHGIQLSASDDLHYKAHGDEQAWDERHTLGLSFIPESYGQLGPKIHFFCDAGSTLSTSRIEVDRDSKYGTYTFSWHTPHACPAVTGKKGEMDGFRIATDADLKKFAEEGETSGEETNGGEDSLKPNRPSGKLPRPWVATLLFALGIIAISVCIVVSSPRVRHFVLERLSSSASALSPIASRALESLGPLKRVLASLTPTSLSVLGAASFRQGDSQLVRWAEEDMALEEDFMVNGSAAYELDGEDWNGSNLDEYIPLTISPKWGRRVRSYGATPLSETISSKARR